jgi:hypothetical protein
MAVVHKVDAGRDVQQMPVVLLMVLNGVIILMKACVLKDQIVKSLVVKIVKLNAKCKK